MVKQVMRFAIKHTVAGAVIIGGIVVFAGASYFALVIWAVLAGAPIGGPLAFPFMVLAAFIASVLSVFGVLLPVTAAAELLCAKKFGWHVLAQVPVATLFMVSYLVTVAVLVALIAGSALGHAAVVGLGLSLLLLVPLLAYWWSLQSADWLISMGIRCKQHFFPGQENAC